MISMIITVQYLNRIADMLDDEEHCLLLTKNDSTTLPLLVLTSSTILSIGLFLGLHIAGSIS